jgi:hypothetical protein
MDWILLPWVIASTIMLFVGAYWVYTLETRFTKLADRYQRILKLAEDADEVTVAQLLARLDEHQALIDEAGRMGAYVDQTLPHTIQGYGVVRYQAFPNVGGDQSFSVAMVDAQGNGVIFSGLHGRDTTRVYAKPLSEWRTSYGLGAEEQEALGQARQMIEGQE